MSGNTEPQSMEDMVKEIQLRQKLKHLIETNRLDDFKAYDWQATFYSAGRKNKQRLLMAANRVGKALSNGTPVATPHGYVSIESLKIGDAVIAGDGTATKVTGVYPQGEKKLYRITFDVGETIDCCGEHLWKYQHPKARYPYRYSHGKRQVNPFYGDWNVDNTESILNQVGESPISGRRVVIPTSKPWQMCAVKLPMHPYLLGSLLGDGCFAIPSGVSFSTAETETVELLSTMLPDRLHLRQTKSRIYDYRITAKSGNTGGHKGNEVVDTLRELDLHGKTSEFKFIPKQYMRGSPDDRLDLLRGLMDTDGSITKTGAMEFSTVSKQLADDVYFLVNSLGGKARIANRQTAYTHKGVNKNGLPSYRVCVRLNLCPFRLERKAERWNPRHNTKDRVVHKIEKIGKGHATCISVEHPDKLFVTNHGIVTHNTFSESREFAFHATGKYPDWWDGIRFKHAPRMWALGVSFEQIRDVIQKELLGDVLDGPDFGKGALPLKSINKDSIIRSPSTRGLVKEFKVWHEPSKSYSSISFKAYEQGQHVLMGQSMDYIWIDEEPRDQAIYPQCVTRTATGNGGDGGYVVMTFTPENGRTPLVSSFLDDIKPGQYIQNVTWDDAPHLDEGTKIQLLGAIPEYQRDMRSKGIPILGSGVIFPVSDEDIKVEPFECPDHWMVLNGMDFGWDHPQAHIQLWIDLDENITYLARVWRKSERDASQAWTAVKNWAKDVPSAWPHDGLQHEKGGGEVLKVQYKNAGFDMIEVHATHVEGGISVESGLWQILQDMREGQFKVFSTCREFFEEKLLYHRDDHGRVVKQKDDIISAARYAYMMKRYAIPMGSIKKLRQSVGIGYAPAVHDFDPYAEN